MTKVELAFHYIMFALTGIGFAFIGFILIVAVVGFINETTAVLFAWFGISFICWLCDSELNHDRKHYPYLCPTPRW